MKKRKTVYDGLYLRGKIWWMNFTADGQHFQRSTGTRDEKTARVILDRLNAKIALGQWHPEMLVKKHVYTYDEMIDRFMREHLPTVSGKMQKSYRNSKAHLDAFFSGKTLEQIDPDLIFQYITARRNKTCLLNSEACKRCKHKPETKDCLALREKRKCKPASRNRERAMLSKAFNLARLWNWIKENPCQLVKSEAENNENFGQCLPIDKEDLLLRECKDRCNGQLAEMVIIAKHAGLREAEVLKLKWPDINLTNKSFSVIQKGNRIKVCPMTDTVHKMLSNKSKVQSLSGYVFVTASGTPYIPRNMYREFKKACRAVDLDSFRFHDIRHTAGTRATQAGHDIYAVASMLGHSQLSTAKRYAKHNVESLRKVVDSLDKNESVTW